MGVKNFLQRLDNRFFPDNRFATGAPALGGFSNIVPVWQNAASTSPTFDFKRLTEEGYRRNSIIYACIDQRAGSFTEPALCVYRKNRINNKDEYIKDDNNELAELLKHPNQMFSIDEMLDIYQVMRCVAGNDYWKKIRSNGGLVRGLQQLRPDRMTIKVSKSYAIKEYVYSLNGVDESIAPEDMIHFRGRVDPKNEILGISPLEVLSRFGDIDNALADYIKSFFINAAQPSGFLKFKNQTLTDPEVERIRMRWRDRFSGMRGWWSVGVLDKDADYVKTGSSIQEIALGQLFGQIESRIMMVMKVPPLVIGSWLGIQTSSYANADAELSLFYENLMMAEWADYCEKFNAMMSPEFGDEYFVGFDQEEVTYFKRKAQAANAFTLELFKNGVIKRNEARLKVGYDEDPDKKFGDAYIGLSQDETQGKSNRLTSNIIKDQVDAAEAQAAAPIDFEKLSTKQWRAVHAVADASEGKLKKPFLSAAKRLQKSLSAAAIQQALDTKHIELASWDSVFNQLQKKYEQELLSILIQAATTTGTFMSAKKMEEHGRRAPTSTVGITFDTANQHSADWAAKWSSELITGINEETKSSIKDLIAKGFIKGITPAETAESIQSMIGLTTIQSNAVRNRIEKQIEEGKNSSQAIKDGQDYADKLLRQRATLIARTETIRASNVGVRDMWLQAVDQGYISKKTKRRWVTTQAGACKTCQKLDGQEVGLKEPFRSNIGPIDNPGEVHPADRCSQVLVVAK